MSGPLTSITQWISYWKLSTAASTCSCFQSSSPFLHCSWSLRCLSMSPSNSLLLRSAYIRRLLSTIWFISCNDQSQHSRLYTNRLPVLWVILARYLYGVYTGKITHGLQPIRPKKFLCFLLQSGKKWGRGRIFFYILFHFYDKTFRVELAAQECKF